jgi:TPR repeat protein
MTFFSGFGGRGKRSILNSLVQRSNQYGLGVPQNTDSGLRWLTLASDQQYTQAQEVLTRLNLKLLP